MWPEHAVLRKKDPHSAVSGHGPNEGTITTLLLLVLMNLSDKLIMYYTYGIINSDLVAK